jgi:hypothetical protein
MSRLQATHTQRLERWLGAYRVEQLRQSMRGWYGPPIHLIDCPGSVRITKDGDFIGPFDRGFFYSAADAFRDHLRRMNVGMAKPWPATAHAGFSSISDALSRASQGYRTAFNGQILKAGPTGVVGVTSSLWRLGSMPIAGGAPGAAPGGTDFTSATTGAMGWTNPAAGTMRLTGADMAASVVNNTLLLYDRIFGVVKTMASVATEAVTGVPSRYQSTTPTSEDYAGGNFLTIEVGGTALANTAHNWTVCTYKDQGDVASTLPSVTGNASAIVDRLDQPVQTWFCPLESGDVGIKALTQMQCSASVATGVVWFVIGHPIGFMSFPIINTFFPFDWLTNRDQAPYIANSACLALYEVNKPATTATTYSGRIYGTSTSS